jgi:DNA-nicking Smr family endonuclease
VKLKLDLHDIYNRGADIDSALRGIIDEAVAKKAPLVEIIPGKGSGQLKKRVLRFLEQKDIKALYHRVEKDSDNFGRVFVHFAGSKPDPSPLIMSFRARHAGESRAIAHDQ